MNERDIFMLALQRENPEERRAYLAEACQGDEELRHGVEALLAVHERAGSFLAEPAVGQPGPVEEERAGEGPGTIIGPYKLLDQIGEGGFGVVFMAEQTRPLRRKVALKVLKPGMDTRQVVARFEAERQALALMEHPNIARVFDGGETASGRPYFVMELVRGVPITQFCDDNHLPVRQRLELFVSVCHAVQHAHQKGIIHRDLKPSNIMVTLHDDRPVVKVIDFGIAKALGQQLTDKTLFTNFAQMIGTPTYMSPEQAQLSGLDMDTRTDIYSLGVLLYELLTSTTPCDVERLRKAAYDEIRRIIREEEPARPSLRVHTLGQASTPMSANRKSDTARLSQLYRGELDWIVMKALEKDRNRRYETASAFAADVQRYLDDEPVQACPPTATYRLRKFVRRYRSALSFAGLFVGLVMLGGAVSAWLAVRALEAEHRATDERDLAQQERQKAEENFALARAAVDKYFTKVGDNPRLRARGLEALRKELLQQAKEFYEAFTRERANDPGVRHDVAMAYYRLARIERDLGQFPAAEEQYSRSIALMERMARDHPDEPDYQHDLALGYLGSGDVYKDTARPKEAEAAYQQALGVSESLAGAHPEAPLYRHRLALSHYNLGSLYFETGQFDRVESPYQQSLAIWTKLVHDHPEVADYRYSLANVHRRLGTYCGYKGWSDKAAAATKQSIRAFEELVAKQPDEPTYQENLANSLGELGGEYHSAGQYEKAEEAHQRSLLIREKLAREHPEMPDYTALLAHGYASQGLECEVLGKAGAARVCFEKCVEACQRVLDREPRHSLARLVLTNVRLHRAVVSASGGDYVRAVQEGEAVAQQEDLTAVDFYNLGCVFSQSSAAAGKDPNLPPAERAALKEQYALRALKILRQTVAKGFQDARQFKTDTDLEPLRGRKDFKNLMQELDEKVKK